jgi:hypothetical protein
MFPHKQSGSMASLPRAVRNERARPLSPRNTIAHTENVGVALSIEVRRGEIGQILGYRMRFGHQILPEIPVDNYHPRVGSELYRFHSPLIHACLPASVQLK